MNQLTLDLNPKSNLYEMLNPEQQAAVMAPINSAVRVMAGAGTGKTELLTIRFIKLALDLLDEAGQNPSNRLWVSTFTEKAAREIKERIDGYLLQAAGMSLHPQAWVGTFHSLCLTMLKRHADKTPHPDGYTLLSDIETEILREEVFEHLLNGERELMASAISAQQLPCSPTCMLPEHLLQMDLHNLEGLFGNILFGIIPRLKSAGLSPLEFYTQASKQTDALTELLMSMPANGWTEHEDYARFWRQHLDAVSHSRFSFFPSEWHVEIEAYKAARKQAPPPTPQQLLKKALKELCATQQWVGYNGRKKQPYTPISPDFSELKAIQALEKDLIAVVATTYALYQQTLQSRQVSDFDDLIYDAQTLLASYPDVQAAYQNHFAHFMVDEFQDSNGGQLQLIRYLLPLQNPGITVVGDKKQSIYGFRFAEPENLDLLFENVPSTQTVHLQTNYRSYPPILAVANRITDMMSAGPPEHLTPSAGNKPHTQVPVCWFHLEDAKGISEAKQNETQWITDTIADLLADNAYSPQDIAVLVRGHQKALQIEEALEVLSIPSVKQRNLGFFQSPVIQQAVSLLALAENPRNDMALINLLQRKLTHHELYMLAKYRQQLKKDMDLTELSYYDALLNLYHHPQNAPNTLKSCISFLHSFTATLNNLETQAGQWNPAHLLTRILQQFPLVTPAELKHPVGKKAQKQLQLLSRVLYHWVAKAAEPLSLADVLLLLYRCQEKDELQLPVEDDSFSEDAVRIMTVHGAKGLQFPVVFLAATDSYRKSQGDGQLTVDPQYNGKLGVGLILNRYREEKTLKKLVYDTVWKSPRLQEEELRLFYVGVTRAKQRLYVSSWHKSFAYINPRFFQDLPVQIRTTDDIPWKADADRSKLAQEFTRRYHSQPPDESPRPVAPTAVYPKSFLPLMPVLTLDCLKPLSESISQADLPFRESLCVNWQNQAWILLPYTPLTDSDPRETRYLVPGEWGLWPVILLRKLYPDLDVAHIDWKSPPLGLQSPLSQEALTAEMATLSQSIQSSLQNNLSSPGGAREIAIKSL